VEVQDRVLGPEHPDVLATRNNLASVLAQQGMLAEAVAEFRTVLQLRQVVLGPEHPDTLATRTLLTGASDALAKARTVTTRGWPAAHRGILVVDMEAFTAEGRQTKDRITMRESMFTALRDSMNLADVPWKACSIEDTGDGILVLVPPELPKILLVVVADELERALRAHNAVSAPASRIRLRMALHAGEVRVGSNGVAGTAVNHAFRLLDALPVKIALKDSDRDLALIVSAWFFEEVVRHDPREDAAAYRRVEVEVKETLVGAWIREPTTPPSAISSRGTAQDPARTGVLAELTDALLAVPSLAEESRRNLLIEMLPSPIRETVPYYPRARLHLIAMIRTCMRYEGGLDALLSAVEAITPESVPVRTMRQTVDRIRSTAENAKVWAGETGTGG
jgi:class 3 adenylate cyclase